MCTLLTQEIKENAIQVHNFSRSSDKCVFAHFNCICEKKFNNFKRQILYSVRVATNSNLAE